MMLFFRLFAGCILQLLPFAALCLYPFKGHFRISNQKMLAYSSGFIAFWAGVFAVICLVLKQYVATENLFLVANLIFMICLIPCFIWYLFLVKDIWQKKLFVFTFTIIAAISMTSLNNTIATIIHMNTKTDGLPYQGISFLILFLFTAITLPALLLLYNKEFIPMADYLSPKEYASLCILSFVLFVILASGFIPLEYSYMANPFSLFLYTALMLSVFLIYYAVFHMFHLAKDQLITERKAAQSEMQLQIQAEQYHQLMNQINSIRQLRHDYRHHLITLQSYAASNELSKIQDYLSQNIKHMDNLTVLLGNLLENAYTAALLASAPNQFIELNIMQKQNLLIITLDNGFDDNINIHDKQYLSTKSHHKGLGLLSIQNIAENYQGSAEFSHDSNCFHSNVILHMFP